MNIDHLALFVRLATTHNISMAGKELGLSAAVSSTYINKLEESLGVKLVHRTTRKVSLSEEGQAFLPHAEEVLANVALARASVGSGSLIPQGKLRVTAPASFGRMHIIPALNDFLTRYPDLTLDLRLNDSIVDMVEGGFDIAIRDAALADSSLIAKKLARDKRIICASPAYLKKYSQPQTPEQLSQHKCVNLHGLDTWQFTVDNKPQSIKTNTVLFADNGEAVRDACAQGIGITLMSTWCAYEKLKSGELVQILEDHPLISHTAIWAVYPSARLLAPKVRAFIDYFSEYYGQTPYWESKTDR
ncbi:LysR family transcriptional regulator [Pseudoalteromonas shioyasakiensis]|uniref:LysR family transcriptional regulator n=1 Tax=Pseudoalteromonas shioyasakiensis TaxID=1190813 RepID=UPI0021174F69|nr:LysR family transcriptional regulator [Pseudoalteromonas shioyasakiensis]MCQ8878016.1 LysR family transcriptional regulator [Pseudoalteromonas shioyasakiensis]